MGFVIVKGNLIYLYLSENPKLPQKTASKMPETFSVRALEGFGRNSWLISWSCIPKHSSSVKSGDFGSRHIILWLSLEGFGKPIGLSEGMSANFFDSGFGSFFLQG